MLLQAMKRDALFIPLFVLIAQQRSVIMFKHNAAETDNMSVEEQQQQVGLLADAFDRCQDSLMQFAEFMQLHVPNVKEYAAMLPPLSQLVQQCVCLLFERLNWCRSSCISIAGST
jgi:hypothetical protein